MIESTKCEPTDGLDKKKFWEDKADSLYSDRLSVLFEKIIDIPSLAASHEDIKEVKETDGSKPEPFIPMKEDVKIIEQAGPSEIKRDSEISPSEIAASSIYQSVYSAPKEPFKPQISGDEFEEKYAKLYVEYSILQKERNELRKRVDELEIRNELTRKKDNAMKQITAQENGFQLVHLIIVAVISLLLGAFLIKSY